MKKNIILTLTIFFSTIALIAVVGMIKFNILQDDLHLEPTQKALVGSWVEEGVTVNGVDVQQGFELFPDGMAASINMATLRYKKWRLNGDRLVLTTQSIGNGNSSIDEEIYRVESLRLDLSSMNLVQGDRIISYRKESEEECGCNTRY